MKVVLKYLKKGNLLDSREVYFSGFPRYYVEGSGEKARPLDAGTFETESGERLQSLPQGFPQLGPARSFASALRVLARL